MAETTGCPFTRSATKRTLRGAILRFAMEAVAILSCLLAISYFFSVSTAFCSNSFWILPPWRVNLRVSENSPNLCPTISSVTVTSTKSLPLCTPKTYPTISGAIEEALDHILITSLLPEGRRFIFSNSFGSTYGPFLELLPMVICYFYSFCLLSLKLSIYLTTSWVYASCGHRLCYPTCP